jgi:hypothetical protein
MKNLLAKLLSMNPIFSLLMVASYISLFWFLTATIWNSNHEMVAIAFAITLSLITKSQSKSLIAKLKSIKAQ